MTNDQIKNLEALLSRLTPGPWVYSSNPTVLDGSYDILCEPTPGSSAFIAIHLKKQDAVFVASAPDNIRRLLQHLKRQAAVVEAARAALEEEATLADKIEYCKPTHGTCCTCQGCGQSNEYPNECRCASNKLHEALARLDGPKKL